MSRFPPGRSLVAAAVIAALAMAVSAAVLALRGRDEAPLRAATGPEAGVVAPAASRAAFRARVDPALQRVVRVRAAVLATPSPSAAALGRYALACRSARERLVAWRVPVTWRNPAGETAIALEQCAADAEMIAAGVGEGAPATRLRRDARRLDAKVAVLRRAVAAP